MVFLKRAARRTIEIGVCLSLVFASIQPGQVVSAQTLDLPEGFDPNFILADNDILSTGSWSLEQLRGFLERKGTLGTYRTADIDGVPKTAPEIIWRVAQSYKLNPQYLIALLQKEQSLVEDPSPSQNQFDWATGYGVCDSCKKDDPSIQEFKGFASQLEWAAKQHREKYLFQLLTRGITIGGQGAGKTVTIDGRSVTPANQATAMLYSYTPHIRGNMNLWKIWQRWFHVSFPDGTIVRGMPSGTTYAIRFGEKRAFASPAVVASRVMNQNTIVTASDHDLDALIDGPTIAFPQYALLEDPDGQRFLIVDDEKRRIESYDAFHKFSFNEDEVEKVSTADLASYTNGTPITVATIFPQGALVKVKTESGVWYVEDGVRHAIQDRVLMDRYFPRQQPKTITQKALNEYTLGEPYRLHDGELVKKPDNPIVYVVEYGRLRSIPSGEVFERIGWKWKNIITLSERILGSYPQGEAFQQNL